MFGNITGNPLNHTALNMLTSPAFKDQEDYVSGLLRDLDEGVLALLYRTLYAAGYRISTVEPQIRKLKQRLNTPSP